MNLNNHDKCLCCFKKPEKGFAMIKHHVSYYPEIIAHVHYDCHNDIHDGKYPHLLQYQEGDSRRFYDEKKKNSDQ